MIGHFLNTEQFIYSFLDGEDYTDSIEAGSDYSNPIPTLSVRERFDQFKEKFGKKYKSK